jgi:hypothetical protein
MTAALKPRIQGTQHDSAMTPVKGNKWLGHQCLIDPVYYVFNQLQGGRHRLAGLPNPRSADLHHHMQEKRPTCDRRQTEASSETP